MTAQVRETLIYEGESIGMSTCPLGIYFGIMGIDPGFTSEMSCNWRGYVGTWEILDNHLYLVKLSGKLINGSFLSLETFFPGYPNRVFANWFSGNITINRGELLEYVHMGFCSIYAETLILDVKNGRIVSAQLIDNREEYEAEKRSRREIEVARVGGIKA